MHLLNGAGQVRVVVRFPKCTSFGHRVMAARMVWMLLQGVLAGWLLLLLLLLLLWRLQVVVVLGQR
jgi:hypothetical protein